ncbi:MAG: c-type cytochrome [Fuerstiella sp.]
MMRTVLTLIASGFLVLLVFIGVSRGVHVVRHGWQSSAFDVAQGRTIFMSKCARCHNVSGNAATVGPNLSQIGSVASQRKADMDAAAYILESVLHPRRFKAPGSSGEMPVNLVNSYDDDAIRGLVAYLCSLGGFPDDNEIRSLVIERPPELDVTAVFEQEQIFRGEELYRGKAGCATCHPFHGGPEYEFTAPCLFYRGYQDRDELRRSITNPDHFVAPRYRQTTVVLANGRVVTGRVINRDDNSIMMTTVHNGQVSPTEIPTADVELDDEGKPFVIDSRNSPMPTGIDQLLTTDEMDDLIAFLLSAN